MSDFQIVKYQNSEFSILLGMAAKLFPNYPLSNLKQDLEKTVTKDSHQIFFATAKEKHIAFAVVSIRTDYVEGSNSSPTGYLESIYVEQEYRQVGIALSLFKKREEWAKSKDCTQMGSDTWLDKPSAQRFHEKIGFTEDDRLVHYIKNID